MKNSLSKTNKLKIQVVVKQKNQILIVMKRMNKAKMMNQYKFSNMSLKHKSKMLLFLVVMPYMELMNTQSLNSYKVFMKKDLQQFSFSIQANVKGL